MKKMKVENSVFAGGNIGKAKNRGNRIKGDETSVSYSTVRKQSFWISLITGVISSIIASVVFNLLFK